MSERRVYFAIVRIGLACAIINAGVAHAAGVSIGGFIPLVSIGLTNEFKDFNSDTFFLADASRSPDGAFLGPGSSAYFDLAILDTGAATHILTHEAFLGFNIQQEGFRGSQTQDIGTAGGIITLEINKPLGVYIAGLGDRDPSGSTLVMSPGGMRGQTSFASLSAPTEWTLPNIIGVPMAAQHSIGIFNSQPQIFQHQGRTVRTPQVELADLGSGGGGILRRAPLKLRPGESFITGPLYTFTIDSNFEVAPTSPTVVPNGALFIEVDMANGDDDFEDKEFLFDTGADFSVISQITAARLGFDPVYDTPDFFLEVESPGGVSGGVPGIFIDRLNIDTVGGRFTLTNVPVAVLDLPNPYQPGNVLDGLIGMHLFNDRNLVIDAQPAVGQGGVGPSLYISDPVTEIHNWATAATSGNWATAGNWNATGTPSIMSDANVANVSGIDQTAVVSANSTVFRLTVSGTPTAHMTVHINNGVTLTTFGETLIEDGGRIELAGGTLDTQFVNIDGGVLAGVGEVFAGTGPLRSPVRILSGRIEPGNPIGQLTIDGDFSQQAGGTLAIDLAGTNAITQYDRLAVDRFAFLDGTLEVDLLSFTPTVGAMFTILTAEEVFGEFAGLVLPAGFQWDITYGPASVVLSVTGAGLAGDFNLDGTVDAADYVVWRAGPAAADDFLAWKGNFGMTQPGTGGSASGALSGVPEPSTSILMALAACVFALFSRRLIRPVRSATSTSCEALSSC